MEQTRRRDAPRDEPRGAAATRARGDSSDDASLTREKQQSQKLKSYVVKDGEFSSFPEIQTTTARILLERGIENLFPI